MQGAVLSSSGQLQNEERLPRVLLGRLLPLLQLSDASDVRRVSVHFRDHSLVVTRNRAGHVTVVKLRREEPLDAKEEDDDEDEEEEIEQPEEKQAEQ